MDFSFTDRQSSFRDRVREFMESRVRARDRELRSELVAGDRWQPLQVIEELKGEAKEGGLWNLFMPPPPWGIAEDNDFEFTGERLTNLEYALCAEEMGRVAWASEVFNCSAPDTGNMEVLYRYGTLEQKQRWLKPLMDGEVRSAFLMTEPDIASSDATNIETSIQRDGGEYVINGRKWWSSGAGDPRCAFAIVMGKTNPNAGSHCQQAMIVVDLDTPGVKIERLLSVYGYDHAPHGHAQIRLHNVHVPIENLILGEGRGFEIAQGRLGPGRIHHCMRTIGAAEEALEAMTRRLIGRTVFGKRIAEHSVWEERVALARIDIEMTRLLCLKAADMMDRAGHKAAKDEIAMIKVQAPRMALRVIDDAVQAHGGAGVSDDFDLAASWANARALRLADGPDEVHMRTIAHAEFGRYRGEAR
jgi:acyl-CoA dehydrogenase